jgi:hypothetical protein
VHRVEQLIGHLTARVGPDEAAWARRILPDTAWPLFDAMPVADRRHGLDVVQRLLAAGQDDPDLLVAALLHDAAKGRRLRLWHRVAGVLLEALAPRALARLASAEPQPGSWRYPFHVYVHHAELGAEAARAAGCSARSVAFIRGTSAEADRALAAALQLADEAS